MSSELKYIDDRLFLCPLCKKYVERLVKHHRSYFPEEVMWICQGCNNRTKLEREHPELCPSKEDADRFYHRIKNDEDRTRKAIRDRPYHVFFQKEEEEILKSFDDGDPIAKIANDLKASISYVKMCLEKNERIDIKRDDVFVLKKKTDFFGNIVFKIRYGMKYDRFIGKDDGILYDVIETLLSIIEFEKQYPESAGNGEII